MGTGSLPGGRVKKWAGVFSRRDLRVANNLGKIPGDQAGGMNVRKFRSDTLDKFNKYYESKQYDKLADWDSGNAADGSFIPVRQRKPRIIYNFASELVDRVAAKLVGDNVFPRLKIETDGEDTSDNDFLKAVLKASNIKHMCMDPVKKMLLCGSALMRFHIVQGVVKIEGYNANVCYPEFQPNGELSAVRVQYTYIDENDRDEHGKPREKWYRLDLGMDSDILYTNPEVKEGQNPVFEVAEQADHGFGFVQAEWFRTREDTHSPDGDSLISEILGFIDEINYSLSQSSQAVGYGQEPQLGINGMDEEEIGTLIRSSAKAWNLGKDGKAEFIETDLKGTTAAQELRDKIRLGIQDIARVVMHDPEKMVGQAQSGRALEILHGPLVELINELRPHVETSIVNAVTKIAVMMVLMNKMGQETSVTMPPGFEPQSLDIVVVWPPLFPMTLDDLQTKVNIGVAAAAANVISRESITRWLANDFGIEDVEAEIQKLASQPVLNPFGAGGF